jgi:hypothetical protein
MLHSPPDRYTTALLEALAGSTPRLPGAACRGRYELFDTAAGQFGYRMFQARAEALAVCAGCPVLRECRQWLDSQPPGRVRGVCAGTVINSGH